MATFLNPGYISWKINWTKLCCWSSRACCWSTRQKEPMTKQPVGQWPFWGALRLAFPSSPRPRMLVPSSGPVLRRPSGHSVFLVWQKAQGLFLCGWRQLCLFSKQRWQYTRWCCLKACAVQMCFRVNLLLPPQGLTPLSHGGTALLLLLICTLFCHPFCKCSDISIFSMRGKK